MDNDRTKSVVAIVIEEYSDHFVAYPVHARGAVVAQSATRHSVIDAVVVAIKKHRKTFGPDSIEDSLALGVSAMNVHI